MAQQLRSIDPSSCWVRHIKRTAAGDTGTPTVIARASFTYVNEARGLQINGRDGWQNAQVTLVLGDDGSFTLTLPNGPGPDGVPNSRRFAYFTDPDYEPGEEWLEFIRDDADERPIFVGTPTDGARSRSAVQISGVDLGVVLAGVYGSDLDLWEGQGPGDVIGHYTRLPILAHGDDAVGVQITKNTGGAGGSFASSGPIAFDAACSGDCWQVDARLRMITGPTPSALTSIQLTVFNGCALGLDFATGAATLAVDDNPNDASVISRARTLHNPGELQVTFLARYDRVFAFVDGILVAQIRRQNWTITPDSFQVECMDCTVALDSLQAETLVAFAGDSTLRDLALPAPPPAGGLRGRYYPAPGHPANYSGFQPDSFAALLPVGPEPATDRLDPTVDFTTAGHYLDGPSVGVAGPHVVRWTGAIYLDLAASDRKIRLYNGGVGFQDSRGRLYVGKTLRGQDAVTSWWSTDPDGDLTSPALRAHIGSSVAGWYPIVIETLNAFADAAHVFALQDGPVNAGGTFTSGPTVVATTRLSPIGGYDDILRRISHRQAIGDVAGTFGLQWRTLPRALRSGQFPGVIEARALVGRQTALVIDDAAFGTEVEVTSAGGDVVDAMLVDAAGISDPTGAGQLSARIIDVPRAQAHMALRQGYESLADITEAPLLRARTQSLLDLRASPNEQVGVRPRAQSELVDTFPLTGVLARMDWMPGDGVILDLESVDVHDQSPRQLTTVTWPLLRDGIGLPTVGFRQRSRTPRATLRRLRDAVYGPRRTYQGSVAVVDGTIGSVTSGAGPDQWSRCSLPTDPSAVIQAELVVGYLGAGGWTIQVNGLSTGIVVNNVGRFDVTGYAAPSAVGATTFYANMVGGGAGGYEIALQLRVRV